MSYTEDQIKKYLEILNNYTSKPEEEVSRKSKCCNCQNSECFTIDSGYKICYYCGVANGHVLGFYDVKDYDRLYFRKKSIYHRKYHYEKKVNQISKRINLTDEQKCQLYDRLLKIDNLIMEILNKQYFRKRLININYLIKKYWRRWVVKSINLLYLRLVLKV